MTEKTIDYKKLSAELDEILASMQSSGVDVDEALKQYERGMEITKQLEDYLKTAENKVTKIKASFESS